MVSRSALLILSNQLQRIDLNKVAYARDSGQRDAETTHIPIMVFPRSSSKYVSFGYYNMRRDALVRTNASVLAFGELSYR